MAQPTDNAAPTRGDGISKHVTKFGEIGSFSEHCADVRTENALKSRDSGDFKIWPLLLLRRTINCALQDGTPVLSCLPSLGVSSLDLGRTVKRAAFFYPRAATGPRLTRQQRES
jgi:hypothetical protein